MQNTGLVTLNLDHLRWNYAQAKRLAAGARTYAVVKSDAYGHGLLRIATALPDADGFALVLLDDARLLREAGVAADLLLLEGVTTVSEWLEAARLGITVVLRAAEQLESLRIALAVRPPAERPIAVWLKVNTGMNRFGFPPAQVEDLCRQLGGRRTQGGLRLRGLMTHFSCADDLDASLAPQWDVFAPLVARTGLSFTAANSAATLRDARTHGDLVRVGSLLYGNNPFDRLPPGGFDFRPVMRLEARLIGVSCLGPGDALGYGASFVADRPLRVGIVGLGYGDGYPYAAPTGTPVLVRGRRTRTVGRVAMNVLAVDLSTLPDAQVGDRVTLWGDEALPIGEVARACGLIPEAIQCGLTKRLPVDVIGSPSRSFAMP